MNIEHRKLQLKNYWRENERLILMVFGAFLIGLVTMGINYISYQATTNKYQLDEPRTITNQESATLRFELNQPTLAKGTTLRMTIENGADGPPIAVSINGEELRTIDSNTAIIQFKPAQLEQQNTITFTRETLGFQEQRITSAKITSHTNFQQLMFVLLNLFSILLMAAPVLYFRYKAYLDKQKMEQKFPEFLRDVVEGTRAGMSLPQAIQNTETGNYGPLDPKIRKMNAQLDWGIPFDQVLRNFGEETDSKLIKRSAETIVQAYESGGDIQDVLESVGDNIRTIKQLKEERESQLYGEMVTGYIVYFIFIGILIALTNYLLPNLAEAQESLGGGSFSVLGGASGGSSLQQNIETYNKWFQRLVFIQAIFSGLIVGKLSEGELKAGLKHVAILFAVGYITTTFFL
ncbi:MAG: type II secretion system F family protein [Candidatus Nanohaloarchaea archaeon]